MELSCSHCELSLAHPISFLQLTLRIHPTCWGGEATPGTPLKESGHTPDPLGLPPSDLSQRLETPSTSNPKPQAWMLLPQKMEETGGREPWPVWFSG